MNKYKMITGFLERIEACELIAELEKIQEQIMFSTLDNVTAGVLNYVIELKVENLILRNVK